MKTLLLICLAIISLSSVAQDMVSSESAFLKEQRMTDNRKCPLFGCIIQIPFTFISGNTVKKRTDECATKMGSCGLKNLRRDITYNPKGVLELLNIVTVTLGNRSKCLKYDGFRAYFAMFPEKQSPDHCDSGCSLVPGDQFGQLTLIFVPTYGDENNNQRHPDDTTQCMIIKDDNIENIPTKYASQWINKVDLRVLQPLEKKARESNPDFCETRSLWYSVEFVKHNWFHNGLWDIINCRVKCNNLQSVSARYAGFTSGKYAHQLSLVFALGPKGTPTNVSLFYEDLSEKFRFGNEKDLTDSGGSDTGKPCPPPTPCSTNAGALLPNQ